jgi:hypothetical protein
MSQTKGNLDFSFTGDQLVVNWGAENQPFCAFVAVTAALPNLGDATCWSALGSCRG